MTAPAAQQEEPFDWLDAGRQLFEIKLTLNANELRAAEYNAEALRQLWARIGHGWIRTEDALRMAEVAALNSRLNAEQARATLDAERAEYAASLRDAARTLAAGIRARCSERTVPSALRREGIEIAATWLEETP